MLRGFKAADPGWHRRCNTGLLKAGKDMKNAMNKTIFLTGATGLVGRNLIPRILNQDKSTRLVLLIRGDSNIEVQHRLQQLLGELSPHFDASELGERVRAVRGDITLDKLGMLASVYADLVPRVTHIIHTAATVKFQSPLEHARKVNFDGTKNVIDFARRAHLAGRLRQVAHISTAYVSGNRSSTILESHLDRGQGFANSYERTKFEAELLVRRSMAELPITVFRPSIIVGDSKTGKTTAFNAMYVPIRLIHHGLVSILPGSWKAPVDVVPVDFVCDAICHILLNMNNPVGKTYHLCAGEGKATTAGEIADSAVDYFNQTTIQDPIPRVTFLPLKSYRAMRPFLNHRQARTFQAISDYAPYLDIERSFDNSNTRSALQDTGIAPPPYSQYYEALLDYCLATEWGKQPIRTSFSQAEKWRACG
jgi:thioester reductase-like protein